MNLFNSIRKRELYYYLSDLSDDELKDIFYISSIILKERKNKAKIMEYLKQHKKEK